MIPSHIAFNLILQFSLLDMSENKTVITHNQIKERMKIKLSDEAVENI